MVKQQDGTPKLTALTNDMSCMCFLTVDRNNQVWVIHNIGHVNLYGQHMPANNQVIAFRGKHMGNEYPLRVSMAHIGAATGRQAFPVSTIVDQVFQHDLSAPIIPMQAQAFGVAHTTIMQMAPIMPIFMPKSLV